MAIFVFLMKMAQFFNFLGAFFRFTPAFVLAFGLLATPSVARAETEANVEAVPLLGSGGSDADEKALREAKRLRRELRRTSNKLKEVTEGLATAQEEVKKVREEAVAANTRRAKALEEANKLAARQLEQTKALTEAQNAAASSTTTQTAALETLAEREGQRTAALKARERQIWALVGLLVLLVAVQVWRNRPSGESGAMLKAWNDLREVHERLLELNAGHHDATQEKAEERAQVLTATLHAQTAALVEAITSAQAFQGEQLAAAIGGQTEAVKEALRDAHTSSQLVLIQILRGITGNGPKRLDPISAEGEYYLTAPVEELMRHVDDLGGTLEQAPPSALSGEISNTSGDQDLEQTGVWRADQVRVSSGVDISSEESKCDPKPGDEEVADASEVETQESDALEEPEESPGSTERTNEPGEAQKEGKRPKVYFKPPPLPSREGEADDAIEPRPRPQLVVLAATAGEKASP